LDFDGSDSAAASGRDTSDGLVLPGRRVRLTVRGLTSSGFLLAEDAGGARYELTPDGNSLDLMHGLLRRKLPA
jgi:biotin--protein ligase